VSRCGLELDPHLPQLAQYNRFSQAGDYAFTPRPFTPALALATAFALALAMLIGPVAAMGVAAAGFRYPFPRIFDRTVMLTFMAVVLLFARRLELLELLRLGFVDARANLSRLAGGFALALAAVGTLLALAEIVGGNLRTPSIIADSALRYLPAAILIAALEEGFFRAFLLAGMECDFGSAIALVVSSGLFAIVHVVRSPARFYLAGFHPAAGAETLIQSGAAIAHPSEALPFLFGLFLLGLLLGEAFILTRRAYCSIGLHSGFVLGAKIWRRALSGAAPRWLAGAGPVPLIAGPAAWLVATILLIALPLWLGTLKGDPELQQS
jgi:membrane protease YdiL (CAAX protease family)